MAKKTRLLNSARNSRFNDILCRKVRRKTRSPPQGAKVFNHFNRRYGLGKGIVS
ncbi:hypothetical protein CJ030_MR6G010480 [Morella rubra]|uniref:Uncharacterized protein n=1 Tax=Morella rubra TaxID=262757 RepID=A0A6A1V8G0_9ROSI|nr:hypothetical protein CJ030_MR6G010480 [Morella rubra]